MAEKALH
jgi:hypothetical protein